MTTLFKVLTQDGLPTHGNAKKITYPLPMQVKTAKTGEIHWKAGEWLPAVARPAACERGYHLTSRPARWWGPGYRLFVAEYRGAMDFQAPDKVACESVRLVEEVTHEWPLLPLYPEIKVLLVASWRQRNLEAKTLPDWAYLSGADLSGANLSRADLSGADLSGAYLSGAYLSGANLSRADLSGADLSGAYLSGANLSRADLSRAYLSGADLSGAYNASLPAGWKLNEYGLAVRTESAVSAA